MSSCYNKDFSNNVHHKWHKWPNDDGLKTFSHKDSFIVIKGVISQFWRCHASCHLQMRCYRQIHKCCGVKSTIFPPEMKCSGSIIWVPQYCTKVEHLHTAQFFIFATKCTYIVYISSSRGYILAQVSSFFFFKLANSPNSRWVNKFKRYIWRFNLTNYSLKP